MESGESLPSRKCGLKSVRNCWVWWNIQSLPSRKCGLKFVVRTDKHPAWSVTSLAEVWIEIYIAWMCYCKFPVTSLAEVWIEIIWLQPICIYSLGHFPRGSVDWNNDGINEITIDGCVTSLAEVWIEILMQEKPVQWNPVTSLAEVWIEIEIART